MIVYDPRGMTWEQYCKLMQELFAPQQIGSVPEELWRDWVDGINGIGFFVQSAIPDHHMFTDWQDWAMAMCGIMVLELCAL